jgi:hypothetical protein
VSEAEGTLETAIGTKNVAGALAALSNLTALVDIATNRSNADKDNLDKVDGGGDGCCTWYLPDGCQDWTDSSNECSTTECTARRTAECKASKSNCETVCTGTWLAGGSSQPTGTPFEGDAAAKKKAKEAKEAKEEQREIEREERRVVRETARTTVVAKISEVAAFADLTQASVIDALASTYPLTPPLFIFYLAVGSRESILPRSLHVCCYRDLSLSLSRSSLSHLIYLIHPVHLSHIFPSSFPHLFLISVQAH